MRNPALHLVGIAASPGGGGIFGTRAEEELRQWLEQRLDALGIDPIAYSRFVLSFLRHPDSALTPPLDAASAGQGGGTTAAATAASGRRLKAKARSKLPLQSDKEQRRAVVQCLKSAADQKCGVETLVDELCVKLKDLEGIHSKDQQEDLKTATDDGEAKVPFETLTPRDRALRYYAAFPALQPVTTPKKHLYWKDQNLNNNNNNSSSSNNNNYYYNNNNFNNNNNNNNNNKNNNNKNNCNNKKSNISKNNTKTKVRQKKNKICTRAESRLIEEKEDLEFEKTMEQKREQEHALDELRLAQLQAKFDESLEALWDTGPGVTRGTDSIWAAPSLSIMSGPSWPTENTGDTSFPSATTEKNSLESPLYQTVQPVDESPLIPWEDDLFNVEDRSHGSFSAKNSSQMNMCWSDPLRDNSWYWGDQVGNLSVNRSPRKAGFFPVIPCKSPVITDKETRLNLQKIPTLSEPDEDLLTSARTHFRPIKEDGIWADGTTFPVNNTLERVAYRRSDSGNLLYLPGGESPYMEYRESLVAPIAVAGVASNFTLKFRVRQCDKSIQTEPIRSPIKRRMLSEQNRLYYSLNTDGKINVSGNDEMMKDYFDLEQADWANQPVMLLRSERKRRHSSSFKARPLSVLRPLTL